MTEGGRLDLLQTLGVSPSAGLRALSKEADELVAIVVASKKTARTIK